MKMKLLNPEQTAQVYRDLLIEAFPPAELKPLSAMEEMRAKGTYLPYGFFDGEDIIGLCFLWLGQEGVALIDHLCVSPKRRNEGLGEKILSEIQTIYPSWVLMAESEYPPLAPDPVMAERRLGFYRRNQAKTADFRSCIFGVPYTLFYWGEHLTMEQYYSVYQGSFTPEKLEKYVIVPHTSTQAMPQVDWV